LVIYIIRLHVLDYCLYISYRAGQSSIVVIAIRYGLGDEGLESRWGARFSTSVQSTSGSYPAL